MAAELRTWLALLLISLYSNVQEKGSTLSGSGRASPFTCFVVEVIPTKRFDEILFWDSVRKVKVKLSLRLTTCYATKTNGGVEVQLHTFFDLGTSVD
jgi:hypothetical protein